MNFDPEIAKDVGTDGAIILENIAYWIDKNQANQVDREIQPSFQNGKWWTYNSSRAFSIQFNWLSQKQIERIIKKLEDKGYLITGNYNKIKYDRTKWFALGKNPFLDSYKSISRNREIETTEKGNRSDRSVEPIPNSNTNKKRERVNSPSNASREGNAIKNKTEKEAGAESKPSGFDKSIEHARFMTALKKPGFIRQFIKMEMEGAWITEREILASAKKCFAYHFEKQKIPNDWGATLYLWLSNERWE